MADSSELEYLRTFLWKVHTDATVKHIGEVGTLLRINDAEKMLVLPGELISVDGDFYVKRYKIQVSADTEDNHMDAINKIIIGIDKFNKRETITGFTRPSFMCHIKLSNSTKAFYNVKSKRWDFDIWLDVEWTTS